MLVVGVAFLLFAALIQFFTLTIFNAALVTGIVMILLGLLLGERVPHK